METSFQEFCIRVFPQAHDSSLNMLTTRKLRKCMKRFSGLQCTFISSMGFRHGPARSRFRDGTSPPNRIQQRVRGPGGLYRKRKPPAGGGVDLS